MEKFDPLFQKKEKPTSARPKLQRRCFVVDDSRRNRGCRDEIEPAVCHEKLDHLHRPMAVPAVEEAAVMADSSGEEVVGASRTNGRLFLPALILGFL